MTQEIKLQQYDSGIHTNITIDYVMHFRYLKYVMFFEFAF